MQSPVSCKSWEVSQCWVWDSQLQGSALGSSILEDNTVSKSSKLETFCSALILLLSW